MFTQCSDFLTHIGVIVNPPLKADSRNPLKGHVWAVEFPPTSYLVQNLRSSLL